MPATPEFEPGYTVERQHVKDSSPIIDAPHIFGFVWKIEPQADRTDQRRSELRSESRRRPTWRVSPHGHATQSYESYGYPSSNHPNGVNVAFCGGQVDFMAESVEPRVYAS